MISIIIPVHNGEGFLGRCLDSFVPALGNLDAEILIIDDASQDATGAICKEYASKYPILQYYRQPQAAGPSAARNCGIAHAKGEYLSFIDSDDYIEPNMIPDMLAQAEKTGADMVCCGYWLEKGKSRKKYVAQKPAVLTAEGCLRELLSNEIIGNYVWNKLYKKELFDGVCFPDGEIYEDIRIMYRIIGRCSRIAVMPVCLYHYIKREGSLTYRPSDEELLLQYGTIVQRNRVLAEEHPGLQQVVDCNMLNKSVFIYSRLAKKHGWQECRQRYREIYDLILSKKHLMKYIPMKYRILGELIVHAPCFHGYVMYGK